MAVVERAVQTRRRIDEPHNRRTRRATRLRKPVVRVDDAPAEHVAAGHARRTRCERLERARKFAAVSLASARARAPRYPTRTAPTPTCRSRTDTSRGPSRNPSLVRARRRRRCRRGEVAARRRNGDERCRVGVRRERPVLPTAETPITFVTPRDNAGSRVHRSPLTRR